VLEKHVSHDQQQHGLAGLLPYLQLWLSPVTRPYDSILSSTLHLVSALDRVLYRCTPSGQNEGSLCEQTASSRKTTRHTIGTSCVCTARLGRYSSDPRHIQEGALT
jgi:hypothetical protein